MDSVFPEKPMPTAGRSPRTSFHSRAALLVLLLAAACGGEGIDALGSDDQDLAGTRIRLMGGNLSSGNLQSYVGPGDRIFAGLKPDVALVQEFNVGSNTQAELDQFVHTTFGASYTYFRESSPAFQIPNGVVSRFPIVDSGSIADPKVSNRAFAWARLRLPGGKFLWAYSLHLLTSGDRGAEAAALVASIKASVPNGDYVVIGGDLNTGTRTEACVVTLSQVVSIAGPFPVDNKGNANTNATRKKPLDWLLVDPSLSATEIPVSIGNNTFPSGLVVDTRVYAPIADLAPALASDSGAGSMQHMGVVRDFLLPDDGQVAAITVTAPNGGETWAAGSTQTITWASSGVAQVNLDWSTDGSSWTPIATSVAAPAGSASWNVPSLAATTSTARVRVSDVAAAASDVSLAPFTIAVTPPPPPPPPGDAYEPDGAPALARPIALNVAQVHDLSPATDADWVTFTLAAKTNVRIRTSGPIGGDTVVLLTDGSGTKQLGTNDDGGTGRYSLMQRKSLAPGTYAVRVTSKNGASAIAGYKLLVSTF